MKHTPGPWNIKGGLAINFNHERIVVEGGHGVNRRSVCALYGDRKPDADLIAAAPDMLDGLRVAVLRLKEITYQKASPKQITFLEEIIAKAEGK